MPDLDPNIVLAEIVAVSANMQTTVGAMTANVKNLSDRIETVINENARLAGKIEGNGGGIKEGMEWKLAVVEEIEKNCPAKDLDKIVADFKSYVETELGPIKSLFLVKKTEDAVSGNATVKAEAAVAAATDGTLVIKYKWLKDLLAKFPGITSKLAWLKHPLMLAGYILIGGGGTIAWNWHNIAHSLKGVIVALIKLGIEAYKNGGG